MAGKAIDFWNDHSEKYLEMAFDSTRRERLENPSGYGKRTGECGDTIEIFIDVMNGFLQTVAYDSNGCTNTHACASTLAMMVEGKPVEEGWNITPEVIAQYLETLPDDEFHCAELAVGAFYLALSSVSNKNL
ncbi:iron-sulfur cluster assembly scaffold protein [Desulforegula conservatrix]|uniref:iron-sulfur cluster assembly scaffold protein n=1 Tax=Desulforegula conservatrix TaxID=153026 RepID=UPI000423D715|nr:iron-sulfur cluster assembly scaffold protein [Desulforegula conservatrix]